MHLRQNDAINSYFIFFSISILLLELYFFLQQPNKALAKIFWNLVVISPMTLSSRKVSIKKRSILWAFVNRVCWRTINFNKTKTIQNNTETHTHKKWKQTNKDKKANKRQTTERQKKRSAIVNLQVDLRSIGTSDVGFRYANFVVLTRLLGSIGSMNFVEEGGPIIKYDGLIGEGKTAQFCSLYWYQRIIHLAFSTITV